MKNKIIMFSMVILTALFILLYFYNVYYKIDIKNFNNIHLDIQKTSTNNDKVVQAYILSNDNNKETPYVIVYYNKIKNSTINDKYQKIIYWNKYTHENSIYWIDDNKVSINNIVLDVRYDKYDYRRKR